MEQREFVSCQILVSLFLRLIALAYSCKNIAICMEEFGVVYAIAALLLMIPLVCLETR
jgi:hypothetical protein